MTANMECEPAAEPGRVRCSIEVKTTPGHALTWADVAIIELPEFAAALKGRIGPADATVRNATTQKWAFGLVARKPGRGDARVRVRGVICDPPKEGSDAGPGRCMPVTIEAKARIQVGL